MTDEIDRLAEAFELAYEPADIVVLGRAEAARAGAAEARKPDGHVVLTAQRRAKLIPQGCGLRIAVDEDRRHRPRASHAGVQDSTRVR